MMMLPKTGNPNKTFSAIPNSGYKQILARLNASILLKLSITAALLVWYLGLKWFSSNALKAEQALANSFHIQHAANQQIKRAWMDDLKGVPPFKYTIPMDIIPEKQIKVLEHDFRWETIVINDKGEESHISTEAFQEYGHEIRYLLNQAKDQFYGKAADGAATTASMEFRKRLHHRAPWLKGDHQQPQWPFNTLPTPVAGKAVIICAGNPQMPYLRNLIHSIRIVHKSSIPIRVVYRDNDDLSEQSRQDLLTFLSSSKDTNNANNSLQFIDLSQIFDLDAANLKAGWNLKPFGLLAVPETQVLSLDVDIILLQSPEQAFESKGYKDTGALFFHDRFFMNLMGFYDPSFLAKALQPNLSSMAENAFRYGNTRYIGEHIQESGMVIMDKSRTMPGVWAICFLLGREDVRAYAQAYYGYGDKELYWIGFETAAASYSFSRYYPGVYGGVSTNFKGTDIAIRPKDDEGETKKRLQEAIENEYALCGRVVHFDDQNFPLWSNGGYFTKEEDWHSSSDLAEFPLNAVWYVDGGDWWNEEFLPMVPDLGGVRKTIEHVILAQAHADWDAAHQVGRMNQHWQTHGGMGVMCLHPNARGIREVPKEIANVATNAAKRFFLEEKKMTDKYGDLW